jgi:hypothetical protein
LVVDTAAFVVGEAGAFAGTSPSQLEMRKSPAALPPPGRYPVGAAVYVVQSDVRIAIGGLVYLRVAHQQISSDAIRVGRQNLRAWLRIRFGMKPLPEPGMFLRCRRCRIATVAFQDDVYRTCLQTIHTAQHRNLL